MRATAKLRRSINYKLGRLVIIAVGAALGLIALLDISQETARYAAAKREALLATAHVFGAASSKAVAARDHVAVLQAMRAISQVPGLAYAMTQDRDGAVLGDLGTAVRLDGDLNLDEADASAFRLLTSRTGEGSSPAVAPGGGAGRPR